jgi:5'-nucleotidase/UDP-sugar diphosphatase
MQPKTFTILHTNDIHSNLIGVGPASEYTPATLNDDGTIGGIERIATLLAERRKARETEGPVLILDIGDFSIGTPFGGAIQEAGAELQCLSLAGYDATTFGNHDFDNGPAALARAIAAAHKAGHVPPILAANTNLDADNLEPRATLPKHLLLSRSGDQGGAVALTGAFFKWRAFH